MLLSVQNNFFFKIARPCALAAIIFLPFARYSIDFGISISIDRVFLVSAYLFLFAGFIFSGKFKKLYLILLFLLAYIFLISFFHEISSLTSTFSYSLAIIYFFVVFIAFSEHDSKEDIEKVIKIWVIVLFLFAFYTLINQYVLGNWLYEDPFGYPFSDYLHKRNMMIAYRAFMPFASAPFLGYAAGLTLIWFLCKPTKSSADLIFMIMGIVVLMSTQSRGPLLSFLLCISFLGLVNIGRRFNSTSLFVSLFIILSASVLLFFVNIDISDLRVISSSENLAESRHLQIRSEAVNMISEGNFYNLVFGHGTGYYQSYGSSPYSFSSVLTIFVDFGIIGVLLFCLYCLYPLIIMQSKLIKDKNHRNLIIVSTIYIFFCHLFYELKSLPIGWVYSGMLIATLNFRSNA